MSSEEKFISVVVNDPRTNKEVGKETWRKGNKETFVPGGLVTRRVEVVGGGKNQEERRKNSQNDHHGNEDEDNSSS